MHPRYMLGCAMLCVLVTGAAICQDAVKVDPKHYKVEMENDQVRVLRVHYGPHEKSVLHSHPNSVAVYLSDGSMRFTDAKGKTTDASGKAGQTQYTDAQVHMPENTGDTGFDAVVIELKGHSMKGAASAMK
jgi:quercetin dioxygenase-like cupin family protein